MVKSIRDQRIVVIVVIIAIVATGDVAKEEEMIWLLFSTKIVGYGCNIKEKLKRGNKIFNEKG